MPIDLITILGPTASGKTSIAAQLAKDLNGEIISADSRQVYKRMDIGTGKDLIEFQKYNVNYHLIDIIEPTEEYNLFQFTRDFQSAFDSIKHNGKLPLMVGGTGLYISAVLQEYNLPEIINVDEVNRLNLLTILELKETLFELKPKLHNVTDLMSKDRLIKAILIERSREETNQAYIKIKRLNIGIGTERGETKRRITERLKERLKTGMIKEVEDLLLNGVSMEKLNYFGLEYKFISRYIAGELTYNDMFQKLNTAIHNFAKRQMIWFRKMEREGVKINWFTPDYTAIKNFVSSQLDNAKKLS